MAAQWISHYATLADRARAAAQAPPPDEDEVPQAARRGSHPPQLLDDEGVPVEGADNPVHQAYLRQAKATMAALQGGRYPGASGFVPPAPVCAHCSRPTGNTRATDGVRSWCDDGCRQQWTKKLVERNREREELLARSQGLPVKGLKG
jgi:hypothetical protein